jgi:hypothetical protein
VSDGETILAIVIAIWIGWPIWSIANDMRALRQMAGRGR